MAFETSKNIIIIFFGLTTGVPNSPFSRIRLILLDRVCRLSQKYYFN